MTKKYSIGYIDKYNDFMKVHDSKGKTRKFDSIEECREYINSRSFSSTFRIMQGWTVIEEIKR